jgi:hypothetical protein
MIAICGFDDGEQDFGQRQAEPQVKAAAEA